MIERGSLPQPQAHTEWKTWADALIVALQGERTTEDAQPEYLPLTGGALTGPITIEGAATGWGFIVERATGGNVAIVADGDPVRTGWIEWRRQSGVRIAYMGYVLDGAYDLDFYTDNVGGQGHLNLGNCGVKSHWGYQGRAGVGGAVSNWMNTHWTGSVVQQYVDNTYIGQIAMVENNLPWKLWWRQTLGSPLGVWDFFWPTGATMVKVTFHVPNDAGIVGEIAFRVAPASAVFLTGGSDYVSGYLDQGGAVAQSNGASFSYGRLAIASALASMPQTFQAIFTQGHAGRYFAYASFNSPVYSAGTHLTIFHGYVAGPLTVAYLRFLAVSANLPAGTMIVMEYV